MVKILKARLQEIRLDLIDISCVDHPERHDSTELHDLACEIKSGRLCQPILVKPNKERFMLVVGARRLEAHHILNRPRIAGVVAELTEEQCETARAISELNGLYLVITPKQVVFSLGSDDISRFIS